MLVNGFSKISRVDFAPPTPTVANLVAGSYEGIAHAENNNGNILFYCTSAGIFNASNNLMPSAPMLISSSATEVVTAPIPGNPNRYYVIYNAETCSHLYYTIVDMSLNLGQGGIVSQDYVISYNQFGEGLELIPIPNTNNYWLLAYQCGIGFTRFRVSEAGIGPPELVYAYTLPFETGAYDGRGELDFYMGRIGAAFAWSPIVFTANFNPVTGEICNPITIGSPQFSNDAYGIDFSPDGSKMYISLWYTTGAPNVFQYNYADGALISFSPPLFSGTGGFVSGLGVIEMGANGKLYIPVDGGSNLVVINNPNEATPTFSLLPIYNSSGLGLSVWNKSFNTAPTPSLPHYDICNTPGATTTLSAGVAGIGLPSYIWWSNNLNPTDTVGYGSDFTTWFNIDNHTYTAYLELPCNYSIPIVQYTLYPERTVDAGADQTINAGESVQLTPSADITNATWYWYPSEGLSNFTAFQPVASPATGTTYYFVLQYNGCQSIDSVRITVQGGVGIPTTPIHNLQVYPNPAGEMLFLTLPPNLQGGSKVVIWETSGKQVYTQAIEPQNQSDTRFNGIPTHFLPDGMYIIQLTTDAAVFTARFAKTR